MKNSLIRFVLILQILFIYSCAPKPIFYNSEASLPYFHSSTKTTFELIKVSEGASFVEFGIIAAKDNDTLSYVLLAPAIPGRFVNKLTDVSLNYAIPVLEVQIREFKKILDASILAWDQKFSREEGISYEYFVAPENRIVRQSENVAAWDPTIKFYFQNNIDGPLGSVLFGEGLLQFYYRLSNLADIQELSKILGKAIGN